MEVNKVDNDNAPEIAPAETIGWGDFIIAACFGFGAFVAMSAFYYPGIHPSVWQDAAVAAGIRPPTGIVHGLWTFLMSLVYNSTGVAGGNASLLFLGKLLIGISAGIVYLMFREMLSLAMRLRLQHAKARRFVCMVSAALGTGFFISANPVWQLGQTFSSGTLNLFLAIVAVTLYFRFLRLGSLVASYVSMFLLGIISSQSPLGIVVLVSCWAVYFKAVRTATPYEMPLLDPYVAQISKWHLTFLFLLGLLAGIALNVLTFINLGGMEAGGVTAAVLPLNIISEYQSLFAHGASALGWACAIAVVIMPFIVCAVLLPRATDEEAFLPYHVGAVFVLMGMLSYVQTAGLSALWFWLWQESPTMVSSPLLLGFLSLMSAATAMFSIVVMGVEGFCRNHQRLAAQFFSELHGDREGDESGAPVVVRKAFTKSVRWLFFMALPVVLTLGALAGLPQRKTRQVLSIINDGVKETVTELGDVNYIFTDGSMDAAIELEGAKRGKTVYAENLRADNSDMNIFLRQRGLKDEEDRKACEQGAGQLMRTWVRDRPKRLENAALQLGIEMWRADGKALPPCSGLLSRPVGMSDDELKRGCEAAKALASRMIAFYDRYGDLSRETGIKVNELFYTLQWRIARMARMRADREDQRGDAMKAFEEISLGERLDQKNPVVIEMLKAMEKMERDSMRQITPRQGLQMALQREDFTMGKVYASAILDADPQDPDANFAMGMHFYYDGQYSRSKLYLERCIIIRPNEPAYYNNIANIQLKLGRYDDALRNAKKALELVPDSIAVQNTVKEIEEAIEKAHDLQMKHQQGEKTDVIKD